MLKLRDVLNECEECGRDWNHGHDHEASMAHGELKDAISNASKIQNMFGEHDNLPGWVSSYITLASDYLHSVAEYMAGQSQEMSQEPGPGYSLGEDNATDKISKYEGYTYTLDGRIVKPKIGFYDHLLKAELNGHLYRIGQPVNGKIELRPIQGKTGVYTEAKPSAGLSAAKKSAVSKKAHAGKDIGHKGKGFKAVEKAAEKKYGSKEAGEKVAAAAMWKNIKR
jgi:hypothetical protein